MKLTRHPKVTPSIPLNLRGKFSIRCVLEDKFTCFLCRRPGIHDPHLTDQLYRIRHDRDRGRRGAEVIAVDLDMGRPFNADSLSPEIGGIP